MVICRANIYYIAIRTRVYIIIIIIIIIYVNRLAGLIIDPPPAPGAPYLGRPVDDARRSAHLFGGVRLIAIYKHTHTRQRTWSTSSSSLSSSSYDIYYMRTYTHTHTHTRVYLHYTHRYVLTHMGRRVVYMYIACRPPPRGRSTSSSIICG